MIYNRGFPGDSAVKKQPVNAGYIEDMGLIPRSGRSPRGGSNTSHQYSCLGNPMDRGTWKAAVYGLAKSWT